MASTALAERTYKVLRSYFLYLDSVDGNHFWKDEMDLETNSRIYLRSATLRSTQEEDLFELMIDCKNEIRAAKAKSNGIKSIDKIMNKTCEENAKENKVNMSGGYIDEHLCQYVTNSYYVLKTNKDVDIPDVPIHRGAFPVGVIGIMENAKKTNMAGVHCPTLSDVKSYIKIMKIEKPHSSSIAYKLTNEGENSIYVDAKYLARIIEFLGDSNISCYTVLDVSKQSYKPLYFTNNNGEEAILCPARVL